MEVSKLKSSVELYMRVKHHVDFFLSFAGENIGGLHGLLVRTFTGVFSKSMPVILRGIPGETRKYIPGAVLEIHKSNFGYILKTGTLEGFPSEINRWRILWKIFGLIHYLILEESDEAILEVCKEKSLFEFPGKSMVKSLE